MIRFPAVHTAVNVETVWVVQAVNFCVLPALILKSLNVLEPVIVTIVVDCVAFQKLFQVVHHNAQLMLLAQLYVNLSVDVCALSVRPVAEKLRVVHVISQVHEPIFMVFVPV